MERRLYRSRKNKIVAGVAGGLGEYFDIDPVLIRVIFVVATLAGASGLLAYLILWIVVPKEPIVLGNASQKTEGENSMSQKDYEISMRHRKQRGSVTGGIVLIVLGALFLADNYLPYFGFSNTWPLILVAVGIGLILNSVRKEDKQGGQHESQ
jgi:phage shock protein C